MNKELVFILGPDVGRLTLEFSSSPASTIDELKRAKRNSLATSETLKKTIHSGLIWCEFGCENKNGHFATPVTYRKYWCRLEDLNFWPIACEASALPLS